MVTIDKRLKVGRAVNYRTPAGTAGKGKILSIEEKSASGTWVVVSDKERKMELRVRPKMLTPR